MMKNRIQLVDSTLLSISIGDCTAFCAMRVSNFEFRAWGSELLIRDLDRLYPFLVFSSFVLFIGTELFVAFFICSLRM